MITAQRKGDGSSITHLSSTIFEEMTSLTHILTLLSSIAPNISKNLGKKGRAQAADAPGDYANPLQRLNKSAKASKPMPSGRRVTVTHNITNNFTLNFNRPASSPVIPQNPPDVVNNLAADEVQNSKSDQKA